MSQLIKINNSGTPSNDMLYAQYVNQIGSEYLNFYHKLNKSIFGMAGYVYEQIRYGMQQFGKDRTAITKDVERHLSEIDRPIKADTIRNYYNLMEFVEDVKTSDKLLYDRLVDQITTGKMTMTPLGYLATSKRIDFDKKKQILLENIGKKVTREMVMGILNSDGTSKSVVTNSFYGFEVAILVKRKYFSDTERIFCPYDPLCIPPPTMTVGDKETRKTFFLDGTYTDKDGEKIPDGSYDGVFLFVPQFNMYPNMEVAVRNKEDFINRLRELIKDAFRITKLNGNVCVLSWNRELFNEVTDYSDLTYREMEKYGDWYNTAVWLVKSRNAILSFKNAAFRTIHVFKKR